MARHPFEGNLDIPELHGRALPIEDWMQGAQFHASVINGPLKPFGPGRTGLHSGTIDQALHRGTHLAEEGYIEAEERGSTFNEGKVKIHPVRITARSASPKDVQAILEEHSRETNTDIKTQEWMDDRHQIMSDSLANHIERIFQSNHARASRHVLTFPYVNEAEGFRGFDEDGEVIHDLSNISNFTHRNGLQTYPEYLSQAKHHGIIVPESHLRNAGGLQVTDFGKQWDFWKQTGPYDNITREMKEKFLRGSGNV